MTTVIGVRFRKAGKVYYFAPGELQIEKGIHVIVETARGVEYGTVIMGCTQVEDETVVQPLKQVIRIATKEDDEINANNRRKEEDAFKICLEKIAKHNLQMKLIEAEYTFAVCYCQMYTPHRSVSFPDHVHESSSDRF